MGNSFFKQHQKNDALRNKTIIDRFRKAKFLAATLLLSFAAQLLFPNVAMALTSGPASPEFSSFEPVATTNMVNEFTGQFVYNIPVIEIPGANGAGYALSLSYHSGDGPETESSWVGYGWSLNPGSINRNKRGVPDDYKNNTIKYYNDVPKNWTISASGQTGGEIYSVLGFVTNTIRYNNYKGFGYTNGVGVSVLNGAASLGYYITDGNGAFSVAVNPGAILSIVNNLAKKNSQSSGAVATKQSTKSLTTGFGQSMKQSAMGFVGRSSAGAISRYLNYMHSDMSSPYNITPYEGKVVSGAINGTGDPSPFPIGLSLGVVVSYSEQQNIKEREVGAYGYMYSGDAKDNTDASNESIMDYTIENPGTFTKRDKYLPVPFSTPDAYFVSGEGLGGSFRMYNQSVGIFSPNFAESNSSSSYFGLDVHLGDDVGVGGESIIDGGWQKVTVKSSWTEGNGNTDDYKFAKYDQSASDSKTSEPVFFRFNNDMGGKVDYDGTDLADSAVVPVVNGKQPDLPYALDLKRNITVPGVVDRNGRSSYVGYRTVKEINKQTPIAKRALAYEQREVPNIQAGRGTSPVISNNSILQDQVGEISVYNEDGNNYVYGLPVYTAGEKNMQHAISNVTDGNSYWAKADITKSNTKVGEEYSVPYASSYLLTQITTPDYVDVNLNGPDDEDFGGYTRFAYKRVYGSDDKTTSSNWYRWRAPYTGVYYNPMRLSDNEDDMGAYQSGYKEVYYLDTVETKTHYAKFIVEDRDDGLDANASDASAATGSKGGKKVKKLTSIELYAKSTIPNTPDVLIKTVHFEYDYSCWPSVDNNNASSGPKGKLTLKRVWFEYNGVVNAMISPYQFDYVYPTSASVTYPSKYASILSYASGLNEQPKYDDASSNTNDGKYIDCWGNYMYDGYTRRSHLQSWDDQTPASSFDPAAWQLKRIILPSGGEIHVQYEQHTYANVEDRPACQMVSLKQVGATDYANGNKYYLNLNDVDMPTALADKERLRDYIKDYYVNKDNKLYFKFLYTLMGTSIEDVGSCNADYIQGYVTVRDVGLDLVGSNYELYVTIDGDWIPHSVCVDYVKTQIAGKIKDGNCSPTGVQPMAQPNIDDVWDIAAIGQQLWNATKASFLANFSCCKKINPAYSYLRIPFWNKKGGGVRVKRLLMYDKGIDASNQTLYGTEYIYENEKTNESFGVATNEPIENKEENPYVTYLDKRFEQDDWDRMFAGKDLDEFEGPIGMNAMPPASIGYSRVIKKNIHQTRSTGGGYTVLDYYTARDYPYDRRYQVLDADGVQKAPIQINKDGYNIDIGLFSYTISTGLRSAQGYCFIQNQMHGQLKSIADYPGMYDKDDFYDNYPAPVSQTSYTYYEPGEQIPMFDAGTYGIYYDQPGKEMDVTIDRRSVAEEGTETRLTGDFTIGILGVVELPWPVAFPITSSVNNRLNSITVNKVIHYPAILKRTSVLKDGYVQHTDNLAFDPLSCKAVVTRTYDGYNGLVLGSASQAHGGAYTNYDIKATSQYYQMGQKAWNERHAYYANPAISPTAVPSSPFAEVKFSSVNGDQVFQIGDMVAMHYATGVTIGHITDIPGSDIVVAPSIRYNTTISTSLTYDKIEIVRSGYTNQLNASAGGFIAYGNDPMLPSITQLVQDINDALANMIADPNPSTVTFNLSNYHGTLGNAAVSPYASCDRTVTEVKLSKDAMGNMRIDFYFDIPSGSSTGNGIVPVSGNITPFLFWHPVTVAQTELQLCIAQSVLPSGAYDWRLCGDYIRECPPLVAKDVLKASITTYQNIWAYPAAYVSPLTNTYNLYESGKMGKWRPYETFAYNKPTVNGSDAGAGQRNYNKAGTAQITLYQWIQNQLINPSDWIRTNTIEDYTPNGYAVQERDALDIYSGAKYGYRGILPYMIGQNARQNAMRFESFENLYNTNKVEENVTVIPARIITDDAHSGHNCYKLLNNEQIAFTTVGPINESTLIQFWAKTKDATVPITATASNYAYTIPVNKVVRTGEWTLFEIQCSGTLMTAVDYTLQFTPPSGTGELLVDDIRLQPLNSKTTAYVYDTHTYRLAATLDEQNLATYYQYNGEGKLTRKLKETNLGVKTVEEVHYNQPTVSH